MFSEIIKNYSDSCCLENDQGRKCYYGDVRDLENVLRNSTTERSLIFCLTSNTIESIAGYVAIVASKSVPFMVDLSINISFLEKLLEQYQPDFIWAPSSYIARLKSSTVVLKWGCYSLIQYTTTPAKVHPDLAVLLSTSGSTGSPKLVRISYANLEANASSIANYLAISKDERPITSLPPHYSYGLSVLNSHFLKGATVLCTEASVVQGDFWALVKNGLATSIAGVPYTYEMLRRLRFFRMELPSLKTLTQAGGHMKAEYVREFWDYARENNKKFVVMYGQTEATARMSYLPPDAPEDKIGSIGVPIPGGKFSLVDDNDCPIFSPHETGNLIYEGPNVFMGYATKKSELMLGDLQLGRLDTGDIAYRDSDGYYFIKGRKNRFIKIYGNRINLDEVQAMANEVDPGSACVGIEDLISVYVLDRTLCEAVKAHLSNKMGLNPRAFDVIVVDEIPKNSAGKILYMELSNRKVSS